MAKKKSAVPPFPQKKAPTPNTDPDTDGRNQGGELLTIDPVTGAAPETRVRDSAALYALFNTFVRQDEKSCRNRAVLTEMVDGAPPLKDAALQADGNGWVYNLNFLEADSRMAAAVAAYDDLVDSSEHLVLPKLKANVVSPDEATDVTDVVADEHATLIREHSEFFSNWNRLSKEFVGHGVGWGYYPDEETPWWDTAGWDNAFVPRRTRASDESVPVFFTKHEYRVDQLYKIIKEPDFAPNWDHDEIKRAIVGAVKGNNYLKRWASYWAEVEMQLKNNDFGVSLGACEVVRAVHAWVREFDGKISFFVILEDGSNKNYLYKDLGRYEATSQAFISFCLGVGNGTFHSIRGALWKMFPFVQTSNRFQNKMLTNADISMTLLLQGEEGDSYDDLQLTLGPAIGYVPASAKVVDRKLPDVGTQGMPVIRHLSDAVQNAGAQFQAPPSANTRDQRGNPPTRFQLESEHTAVGALTNNAVNRFCRSLDKLFNEQFMRIQKIGPTGMSLSGGKCKYPEVKEFYERCADRGVNAELIQNGIRRVSAVRSIGNGSPQMRLMALDRLQQMKGSLDETGRDLADRDYISMAFGRTAADRYKPKVKRIAPDVTIALLENSVLKIDQLSALPDQNHSVHAGIHIPRFQEAIKELVQAREQNPEADFAPLQPLLQEAFNNHDHSSQHVEAMAADPLRAADMKSYRAALEQGANLLAGFARQLQQQERHHADDTAAMQQQSQQQPGQQQPGQTPGAGLSPQDQITASDPTLALKMQRQQEELVQKRETHRVQLQLASAKVAEISQKMQLRSIQSDQVIARGIAQQRASVPVPAA
jgi:hypothetical protein